MGELNVVGQSVPRVDGLAKVTGKASFVYDMVLPGMLWGKILRSSRPHAKILNIDASEALRLPGVRAVITSKELGDVLHGAGLWDEPVLARDRVRFVGEGVAAVAADTLEAAEEAVKLIKVEYEDLPAVFDVEEAFSTNPPAVIHPDLKSYGHSPFMPPRLIEDRPNVYHSHTIQSGNLEEGFKLADVIVENRYTTARIHHCQMEPHCAIAQVEADGSVTVWASINTLHAVKNIFCHAFKLPFSRVRVIAPNVGGGFGGKQDIITLGVAYGLARVTGRPVKVAFTREEVFVGGTTRHPTVIYIKDGATKDGTLVARDITLIQNGGAYAEYGYLTVRNACYGAVGTYKVTNFRIRSYGVYTNEPIAGAFRGFGNVQVEWAIESQMDILAEKLGLDPVEFRLRNVLKEGDRNAAGERVHSIGAAECLEKVVEAVKRKPSNRANDRPGIKRGIGIALGNKYSLAPTASCSIVKVYEDGAVEIRVGVDEVGQGMRTVLAQIAAEEFGVKVDEVRVVSGDTALCPYDEGSISSRTTYNTGNAVRSACRDAKAQLFKKAADILEANENDLECKDKKIFVRGNPSKFISVSDVFSINKLATGRYLAEGGEILGKATWYQGTTPEDRATGTGERLTAFYTHGAQAVEVAVDEETGRVLIERSYCAYDMGRAINPMLCEGQIEGGNCMAIGSALMEKMVLDQGATLNANFTDYLLPTSMDMPVKSNDEVFIVEALHEDGPYGAKGLGEGTMAPTAPAIANAIYNAVGVRIKDLPIEPEVLLDQIKNKGRRA